MSSRTLVFTATVLAAAAAPAAASYRFDAKGQLVLDATSDAKPAVDTATLDLQQALVMADSSAGADLLNVVHARLLDLRDTDEFTAVDARALSTISFALDQRLPAPGKPSRDLGSYRFEDLPRSQWWRMFIDYKHWRQQDDPRLALIFDSDSSPGYYAAMMAAFDRDLLPSVTEHVL